MSTQHGIFTGLQPQSAHEELEYKRLTNETIRHHQNGTADTPEGKEAFAKPRKHIDSRTVFLHEDMFKKN